MRNSDTVFDPSHLDPSFDFVFRDFERSKIQLLRGILAEDRGVLSIIYFVVVLFWTMMMSYGAVSYGNGDFAVNLAPHVSFYSLIIGTMLYPREKVWIPILAFTAVFFLPFFVHNSPGQPWVAQALQHPGLVLTIYTAHIVTGILIGTVSLKLGHAVQIFSSKYSVDLLTVISLFGVFIVVCLAQNVVFAHITAGFDLVDRLALGFDGDFAAASSERVLRGGVVVAGFMLAVLEVPNRSSLLRGVAVSSIFLALAIAQGMGYGFHVTLDVCFVALMVVSVLPTPTAVTACIVGVPVHSALTGTFLSTAHLYDEGAAIIERYAIALLVIIILIPALRSPLQHGLRIREASLRRFSMVRDFANVGLLSFNLDRKIFRTDSSAQRLLETSALGDIRDFITLFSCTARPELTAALSDGHSSSVNLLLHRDLPADANGARQVKDQVLRMCLWYERAPSGESVAYGLVLDVTGEHDQERVLQETLAELSLRQERQRQLFSIVSHELRTPASVISMLIDDLDEARPDSKAVKQLHEATDQLMSTLADMRQTVNPTQNLPVTRESYSPADLADSLRNMFEPKARDHGMTIRLALTDCARANRLGDHRRLRQAISNLLRNAILHSGASVVEIAFHEAQSGHGACLSRWTVTDNGRGIAPDQIERLFQPFERGEQDPRSHVDGSGLGLYIVKSSIETLGGTITHFVPPQGGTGFVIEVPETKAAESLPKQRRAKKSKAPDFYADLRVLVAEDNALVAEVTLAKLSRLVGRVELAVNGRDAFDKCTQDAPDLLITDLFMPEMDGDRLIASLRQRGMDLPIVGLTAAAVGDDIERLKAAGASMVMVKPLDINALEGVIRAIAQSKGAPTAAIRQRKSA